MNIDQPYFNRPKADLVCLQRLSPRSLVVLVVVLHDQFSRLDKAKVRRTMVRTARTVKTVTEVTGH